MMTTTTTIIMMMVMMTMSSTQGEARVFKYLHPNNIDVRARRRKVQAMINSQSPFYRKKRILNFVEEREYSESLDAFCSSLRLATANFDHSLGIVMR